MVAPMPPTRLGLITSNRPFASSASMLALTTHLADLTDTRCHLECAAITESVIHGDAA